jgi:hypothetical protein
MTQSSTLPDVYRVTKTFLIFLIIAFLCPSISRGLDKSFATTDWGPFADSGATLNNGVFTFPTGAENWAGFYNSKTSLFPLTFPSGGKITFTASVPNGGSANVQFRFERLPYPDDDPAFDTIEETVTGSSASQYTIEIPAQGTNTFSSFLFYIVDRDVSVALGNVVVTEYAASPPELPEEYANYYTPSNVGYYTDTFPFGENESDGSPISWQQEVVSNPYNNEIQQYKKGYAGLDDNDNLVLKIQRTGNNTFYSSRVNSQNYDGIKVGLGEKLSIEFEAQLPVARDSNGNYVPNVPLWPALWLMGNDQVNNNWIEWPHCAEIDVMEWSPTKSPQNGQPGYYTQANVAYHWDGSGFSYNPYSTAYYYSEFDIHTQFHKWRVDIYRYEDGTTNKIEMFLDDIFISGSRFTENNTNQEFWRPSLGKDTESFGTGDKEYFIIMNIAMGGWYPETSSVPSDFEYAEMVVKNVSYQITSLTNYTLDLTYDSSKISVVKDPDLSEYPKSSTVQVQATPSSGYLLEDTIWTTRNIFMNADKSFNVTAIEDTGDDDGDGLNNYEEAIVYNSNLNSSDSDNDNYSDYFESIAGTSLIDANDYFYLEGSLNSLGIYNLAFDSKLNRNYSIKISDNLDDWYDWKTESGDGTTHTNNFDPSIESITGIDADSNNFFFKVDIEKQN